MNFYINYWTLEEKGGKKKEKKIKCHPCFKAKHGGFSVRFHQSHSLFSPFSAFFYLKRKFSVVFHVKQLIRYEVILCLFINSLWYLLVKILIKIHQMYHLIKYGWNDWTRFGAKASCSKDKIIVISFQFYLLGILILFIFCFCQLNIPSTC